MEVAQVAQRPHTGKEGQHLTCRQAAHLDSRKHTKQCTSPASKTELNRAIQWNYLIWNILKPFHLHFSIDSRQNDLLDQLPKSPEIYNLPNTQHTAQNLVNTLPNTPKTAKTHTHTHKSLKHVTKTPKAKPMQKPTDCHCPNPLLFPLLKGLS